MDKEEVVDFVFDIDHYQEVAKQYAIYPEAGTGSKTELSYLALGLTGESGEVADKVKKWIRDGKYDAHELSKELGDVFWYLANLCKAIGYTPSTVLTNNLIKLGSRKERDTLKGEGDNR